jgi:hypothetical protein
MHRSEKFGSQVGSRRLANQPMKSATGVPQTISDYSENMSGQSVQKIDGMSKLLAQIAFIKSQKY